MGTPELVRLWDFCPGCGFPCGIPQPWPLCFCGESGCGLAGRRHGTHPGWHGRLGHLNGGCTCTVCTTWAAEHPEAIPGQAATEA